MTPHFASSDPLEADDLDFALLERYWVGETSLEETATVEGWLQAHPQWRVRYGQLRHEISADHWADLSTSDIGRRITKVLAITGLQDATSIGDPPLSRGVVGATGDHLQRRSTDAPSMPKKFMFWRQLPRTAGAVAVGAMLLLIGWQTGARRMTTQMAIYKATYTTPNGQRANITLPDGSEVTLNAGSRLDVPSDFAMGARTIDLTGEALFTVKHQGGKPFTVVAGPSITRVLGTRFAVRHYATDAVATIAVQEGKVSVDTIVLTANRQVQVNSKGVAVLQRAVPEQFSFAEGRLVINDVPLKDAISDLNRWYDVDIRLGASALKPIRLTLESAVGSRSDLQKILEVTLSLRVERKGRILTLFPR